MPDTVTQPPVAPVAPAAVQPVATPAAIQPGGGLQVADLRAAVSVLAGLVESIPGIAPAVVQPAPVAAPDVVAPDAPTKAEPATVPAGATDPLAGLCAAVSDMPAVAGTLVAAESRLRSSRLWTTVGGIAALGAGHFAGLPPITQVCITTLIGLYCIVRTIQGSR